MNLEKLRQCVCQSSQARAGAPRRGGRATLCLAAFVAIVLLESCQTRDGYAPASAQVIQTSRAGDRLSRKADLIFIPDDGSFEGALRIDPETTYQSILGFGAALTELSAYVLDNVPPEKRDEVLRALFSPDGAWFTLCRTHINSLTFFPTGQYDYDSVPGDFNLSHFDISHDLKHLIPLIRDAGAVKGARFELVATPWTPPAWMKMNGKLEGGSPLRPESYDAWALYFSKYIKAYAQNGIHIDYVTVQNESEYSPEWHGCVYTPEQQKTFVAKHLGPRLERDGLKTKILIYDHNTDHIVNWADAIYSNPEEARYVWGTAFHWYEGDHFENVATVHNKYPGKHLLFTEGCETGGGHVGEWGTAEHYAHAIIGDLNNWTEGWIDWNMTLDETGGPVPANIKGDAWRSSSLIMVHTGTGELIYNPYYYAFSHFSKYIRPGARRIQITSSPKGLETTAFKNLNGTVVIVAFNAGDNTVPVKLVRDRKKAEYTLPGHSIVNFIYKQ